MKPSTYRALKLLREHDSVTTHDFLLAGCGSRFGARLAELRHEHGCVIDEQRLTGDVSGSRYRLISEPTLISSPALGLPAGDVREWPADTPVPGVTSPARAQSSNPCPDPLSPVDGQAPASLLVGQANTSGAPQSRCAIYDDDLEDEAA